MKRAVDRRTARAYDFTGGVRGKYAERYRHGTNLVRLDPDVRKAFPTDQAVNMALRVLASTGRRNP
ncbi:MAG: hypothetical protein AAB152_03815 [Candidatus Coatesbacteria bacterium]